MAYFLIFATNPYIFIALFFSDKDHLAARMAPLGADLARKMSSLSEGYGSEDGLQERGDSVELHKQIFTNRS